MSAEPTGSESDDVNRLAWSSHVSEYVSPDTWTDPGERNVLNRLAPRIRNGRILDVGVGAGRTAWILPLLSDAYVAIDYTPEMVKAARDLHPALEIRTGDARRLDDFEDGSFDFVMFSYNGLDALGDVDRQTALGEFYRVLVPGGILMFSTLDRTGIAYRERPWDRIDRSGQRSSLRRAVTFSLKAPFRLARYWRETMNWNRLRKLGKDHGDWAIGHLSAHEFGLLVHYITPEAEKRELERHGFILETMTDDNGVSMFNFAPRNGRTYFHVVATKL